MSIDPIEAGQKALQILTHLVEGIGPRPAGSPSENETQDWLEKQFKDAKINTFRFPVKYQPDPVFFPYFTLAAIGFLAAGYALPTLGWVCLILPPLILILPEAALWLQSKILPFKEGSSNLIALNNSDGIDQLDIILCAHIDTARAVPVGFSLWRKWREEIFYTMMRAAMLLSIIGVIFASGFELPTIILLAGQIIAFALAALLVLQDIWEQIGSRDKFTQGANDNASGVSVLAAMALGLQQDPPKKLKVGFLFTGAEECGLHGAKQFTQHLSERNLKPMIVSVDMVGAGSGLRIISRSGTLFPVKTNSRVNELLKRADPLAEFHAAPRRWGDFVPFARAGISAGHLENNGTPLSWSTYHTGRDDLVVIDPEMLQHTVEVLTQFIWILDKNK